MPCYTQTAKSKMKRTNKRQCNILAWHSNNTALNICGASAPTDGTFNKSERSVQNLCGNTATDKTSLLSTAERLKGSKWAKTWSFSNKLFFWICPFPGQKCVLPKKKKKLAWLKCYGLKLISRLFYLYCPPHSCWQPIMMVNIYCIICVVSNKHLHLYNQ